MYGSRDSIVPPEQSRAVAEAAAGETRVVEIAGADHNDPALLDGEKRSEFPAPTRSGVIRELSRKAKDHERSFRSGHLCMSKR